MQNAPQASLSPCPFRSTVPFRLRRAPRYRVAARQAASNTQSYHFHSQMQRQAYRLAASQLSKFAFGSSLRSTGLSAAAFASEGLASHQGGRTLRIRCYAAQSTAAMDAIKKLMKDPELFKTQALIGGEWSDSADGDTVDVRTLTAVALVFPPVHQTPLLLHAPLSHSYYETVSFCLRFVRSPFALYHCTEYVQCERYRRCCVGFAGGLH